MPQLRRLMMTEEQRVYNRYILEKTTSMYRPIKELEDLIRQGDDAHASRCITTDDCKRCQHFADLVVLFSLLVDIARDQEEF